MASGDTGCPPSNLEENYEGRQGAANGKDDFNSQGDISSDTAAARYNISLFPDF